MNWTGPAGWQEFLHDYPLMAFRPSGGAASTLKGRFAFNAYHDSAGAIEDSYELEVIVPSNFPNELPKIRETGLRIPRKADFHVNETDGTLCLGSPLSLIKLLHAEPTLTGFARSCIIPYLYAISHRLANGGGFAFGELAHGTPGLVADYMRLFGVADQYQVREVLTFLGMKKRLANKGSCPCGCGLRLGRCRFNLRLHEFRELASRPWYRKQLAESKLPVRPPVPPIRKRSPCSCVVL